MRILLVLVSTIGVSSVRANAGLVRVSRPITIDGFEVDQGTILDVDVSGKAHFFSEGKKRVFEIDLKSIKAIGAGGLHGVVDLDDDDGVTTIFSVPGYNWRTCKNDRNCKKIAWPRSGARVTVLESRVLKTVSPFTNEPQLEVFYRVRYEYTPKGHKKAKSGEGWIPAAYVELTPVLSKKEEAKKPVADTCPPTKPKKEKHSKKSIEEFYRQFQLASHYEQLEKIQKLIGPKIGNCFLDGKQLPKFSESESPFEQSVVKHWERSIIEPDFSSALAEEADRTVTKAQLMEIDTAARTLYGELAACIDSGEIYGRAVARLALNRSEALDSTQMRAYFKSRFAKSVNEREVTGVARVFSAHKQFHVWNSDSPALKLALCPPSDPKAPYWHPTDKEPSTIENRVWSKVLRLAIELVLFPEELKKTTPEIDYLYYSSRDSKYYRENGFDPQFTVPKIAGKPLRRTSCVLFWESPKDEDEKKFERLVRRSTRESHADNN